MNGDVNVSEQAREVELRSYRGGVDPRGKTKHRARVTAGNLVRGQSQ